MKAPQAETRSATLTNPNQNNRMKTKSFLNAILPPSLRFRAAGHRLFSILVLLSFALAALALSLAGSALGVQYSHPDRLLAKTFDVMPGTDTLTLARDAVRAWRAAGHANEAATIRLSRGEYLLTGPVVLAAEDGNVAWEARDPDHTVVSGGAHIITWSPDRTGIWHAQSNFHFEQLYVNGRRAVRARLPAEGFYNITGVEQEELPDDRARLTIKVPLAAVAALPADAAALHDVQLVVFHKWETSRYAVSAFDMSAGTITVEGGRMSSSNPWNEQTRFILDNVSRALTQPGSWFLEGGGDLDYLPCRGEQIGNAEFIAPVAEQFVVIHGANDVHFNGLRFRHAGYQLPAAGCPPGQAAAMIGAAIEIDGARNVTFENGEIAHTGNYGIWFRQGCHDCRIGHCLLEDLGAGGIRIGEMEIRDDPGQQTGGIVADNNIIRGCGRVHPSAVGVWIGQSANNRITHNDISDTFYTGISVGWTWGYGRSLATNNFIGFNRVHQIGQGVLSDMGGIYTLGVSLGSACVGNVFYDVRAHDYGGWGIYPDEGSSGWRITSNLVWNCTSVIPRGGGAFHQHYGATNYVANNIFAFSSGPVMQATRVEDHLSFILEHNLIVSSNTAFYAGPWDNIGPWDKIQFESRSNCFAFSGSPMALFPNGDLSAWQKAGHEAGSILTNLEFIGRWPDVTLPRRSPAFAVGFEMFDPKEAGVYGGHGWIRLAKETENKTPSS